MVEGLVDTIRLAVKSDIPQMIDLMNSQYSRKRDEWYFKWQYFNSSYPTISMCAFINNRLVGMFGLQKRKLKSGAHVGQAIDLLIDPKWRKKGIFKLLGEKAIRYFQNLDLLCVLPNLNGKNACEEAFGWKTLGRIDSVVLHRNSLRDMIDKFPKVIFSIENEQEFERFNYTDEVRSWRFDQHPNHKYTYVSLTTGEFAVTKVFQDPDTGVRYGDIVDFECNLNNQELLRELFLRASLHLKEQNVECVTTWALPHTPLYEVVESLGFVKTPMERYFCIKVLKPRYEYLYNFSAWHLVQADAEIY